MHLNKRATRIFETLVDGLEPEQTRKLANGGEAFLPVTIERLTESTFSVTHYYEQNGDLVPDPDVQFWKCPKSGLVYPVAIQHATGHYTQTLVIKAGKIEGWRPRQHKDLCRFVNKWLENIRRQQDLKVSKAA